VEGLLRLALTAVLLVIVVVLSYLKRVGLEKEVLVAAARGFVQLMLLAVVFAYIFDSPDWLLLIWALFIGMALIAGHTSARRAQFIPRAFRITTPSIVVGSAVALVVMALTGIMPFGPQFVIPLSGMAFGNSMKVCSLTLDRMAGELKSNRAKVEAALALGATSNQAMEPYTRVSIRAALMANIDSMKTLGIIFIPGAMAGLLMAGTPPLVAAEYQIVVYFMILSAGIITALLVSTLARRHLFTEAHQLVEY